MASRLPFARTLVEGMMAMEVKISVAGNERNAAVRAGTPDDLVFARALAYWSAQKVYANELEGDQRRWRTENQADAERVLRKWKRGEIRGR